MCWDNSGEFIASVSQDLVKVWSISSGECIHELSSNGNKFHSCVFHPSYTNLLVIGGYQVIVTLLNLAITTKQPFWGIMSLCVCTAKLVSPSCVSYLSRLCWQEYIVQYSWCWMFIPNPFDHKFVRCFRVGYKNKGVEVYGPSWPQLILFKVHLGNKTWKSS